VFDGDWRDNVRARRTTYGPFQTPPLSIGDAECLEGLLRGEGYHFDFETNLYDAVKNYGPDTGYAGTTISNTQAKIGTYSMYVTSGSAGPVYTSAVDMSDGYVGDWSVGFWQYVAAWKHFVYVYDADTAAYVHYVDGAVDASPDANEIAYRNAMVASGAVSFIGKKATDNSASACYYDDAFMYPFKVTAGYVTAIYNGGTGREVGDRPYINVSGDVRKSTTTTVACRGALRPTAHTQLTLDDAWTDQARVVSFLLRTVSSQS
jgi:hypothetical protein